MKVRNVIRLLLLLSVIFVVACSNNNSGGNVSDNNNDNNSNDNNTSDVSTGGDMKLAWNSEPPTLDTHITNTNVTRDIARQVFETLVTFDENYEIIPMLAESFEENEDGSEIKFKLREGVPFHNGKEMTSEDVVASMERWQTFGTAAVELGESEWEIVDDYNITLHVDDPSIAVIYRLADPTQKASIYPKEIVENSTDEGIKEFIGTGPFYVDDWQADHFLKLSKFEDYSPSELETSGLGGHKEALVDSLEIHFVSDDSTRVNGIITGEYDYAFELPFDSFDQLDNAEGVINDIWPFGFQTFVLNKRGIFKDKKIRKAANLAIDNEELLSLAFVDTAFYELEPAFMRENQVNWYTKAGEENYNVLDREKAKSLLDEAGYNGEEVIILTSNDYSYHYNSAVYAQQALKEIGMNVELEVTDWATLLEYRTQEDLWDGFFTQFTTVATPLAYPFLDSKAEYPGWTNDEDIDRLLDEIRKASDQDEATEKFEELQEVIWDELPVINMGLNNFISSYRDDVKGYSEFMGPIFWNMSLDR